MFKPKKFFAFLENGEGDICVWGGRGEGGGGVHFPRTLHKGQIEFLVSANCSPPEIGQSGNVSGGVALVDFFCLFLLQLFTCPLM
jgi:hypothetical protein